VNCGPWSYFHYIAITCLLYSHTTIAFHSIRLYPLFQANRWDWQPYRKLGTKYLVVLCAGSTLQLAKQSSDEAPYKLSGAVAKLASITFLSLAFSYWFDKPWFLTEEKTCCYIHQTFSWGFATGRLFTAPSIAISPLGFSRWSEFIGGRAMSEGARGPTPYGGVARGGAAPPYDVAASRIFSVSTLNSVFVLAK
jgi:hypothetical protein